MKHNVGDHVIFNNQEYVVRGINPDRSLRVQPVGSNSIINIPDNKEVFNKSRQESSIYSGRILG